VALGGSLPSNSASRSICDRGPFGKNLRKALEPDSTKRQLQGYRQGKSFSDFWKSYRPVFEEEPTHRQVGKSSGELAHVERFFGRLRQKLARYVRRTRAASESERMLHLTTKLFVEWYNKAVT
jgi:insertion element IS1 protein InsB